MFPRLIHREANTQGGLYTGQAYCAINPYRTRAFDAPILKYNIIHTASYKSSIEVYVVQTWNALDPDMRNAESLSEFEKLAKAMLQERIPKNKVNLYE